jgi:hypothetical protein
MKIFLAPQGARDQRCLKGHPLVDSGLVADVKGNVSGVLDVRSAT